MYLRGKTFLKFISVMDVVWQLSELAANIICKTIIYFNGELKIMSNICSLNEIYKFEFILPCYPMKLMTTK